MVTSPTGTLAADGAAEGNGTNMWSDERENDERIGDAARTTESHLKEHGTKHCAASDFTVLPYQTNRLHTLYYCYEASVRLKD